MYTLHCDVPRMLDKATNEITIYSRGFIVEVATGSFVCSRYTFIRDHMLYCIPLLLNEDFCAALLLLLPRFNKRYTLVSSSSVEQRTAITEKSM